MRNVRQGWKKDFLCGKFCYGPGYLILWCDVGIEGDRRLSINSVVTVEKMIKKRAYPSVRSALLVDVHLI